MLKSFSLTQLLCKVKFSNFLTFFQNSTSNPYWTNTNWPITCKTGF